GAADDGDLLELRSRCGEPPQLAGEPCVLCLGRVEAPRDRLRSAWTCRPEHLLGPAETRHETVRERQDLRARAVVLLEPDDRGVRGALREPEQGARGGAGEG